MGFIGPVASKMEIVMTNKKLAAATLYVAAAMRREIEFGIFPFKYNAQVRNLGECFFRSGAYPAWPFEMNRL